MSVRVRGGPSLWKMRTRPRPDTATLERPIVLDPGLLRSIDMTRLTRDRLDHLVKKEAEQERSASEEPRRVMNATFRVRSHVRKGLREVFSSPSQLQQPTQGKEVKTKSPKSKEPIQEKRNKKSVEDIFGTLLVSVPSPCSTCGRTERPERLHAHPSVPRSKRSKLRDDQENNAVRASVTKPVAMKFRSGKTRGEKLPESPDSRKTSPEDKDPPKVIPLIRRETFKIERGSKDTLLVEKKTAPVAPSPSPTRKTPVVSHSPTLAPAPPPRRQALPRTPVKSPVPPPEVTVAPAPLVHSGSSRRPRTITCYLCLKQFGTASYHLHEPQCLQKWHRENQSLPVSQQLPEPERPRGDGAWDNAWEVAQAAMVTCEGCSKTFLPHRLEAHLRVCPHPRPAPSASPQKPVQSQHQQQRHQERQDRGWESDRSEHSSLLADGPPSIHCHICGRMYSREAVERHEQQCLRRWQLEHSRDSSGSGGGSEASSPPPTPRRRLVLCYLCGRQFGTASITIHEPQCLRKWRQENDRLPPGQRRPEPPRPEPVYDSETGQVDYQATADVQWKSHLVQLVPCGKCGRTFNPDRVTVHEKCCKGPKH